MRGRSVRAVVVGAVIAGIGSWAGLQAAGQEGAAKAHAADRAAAPKAAAPRTSWGDPDLQGVWVNASVTPLERPAQFADKAVLSEQEAVEFEKLINQGRDADRREAPGAADVGKAYNQFWYDFGTKVVGTRRTSLVIDPPNGLVPALTPAAQKAAEVRADARKRSPADSYEDRSLWERCISTNGVPRLPGPYNNNYQILQTRDYVAIVYEMIHETRLIPLDGRPHAPGSVRQWLGDSRARWEGNVLVIDTTNFSAKTNFRGFGAGLHLVERFTRVDADNLVYEFTVDDPATWTTPWTAQIPTTRAAGRMYEYACHEGNHAMVGILSGARADEKAAAEKATGK